MRRRSRRHLTTALLIAAGFGVTSACAQDYPSKPIRILAAAAGGGNDFIARQIAQSLSATWGQPVIVDNRPGLIAVETASKAVPDGYTLYVGGAALWIRTLFEKMPYDVEKDFTPISLLLRDVNVLVVHPSVAAKSVQDLVALARAKPGALNYASTAAGGPTHLAMELFNFMAGVNIARVPYKGTADAVNATLGGEAQTTIIDAGLVMPHAKSGRLRALAVTSAGSSALAPGLPTIAASGIPGFESVGMTVFFAPGRTPAQVVNLVNQETVRFLNRPESKDRFLNAGAEVVASSPQELAATIKSDLVKWGKVISVAKIKVN